MQTDHAIRRGSAVIRSSRALLIAGALQLSALLSPSTTLAQTTPDALTAPQALQSPLQLAQARQCERREGPFATQDTAWQRWRQTRARGFEVSQGVVPCRDQYGTRGYCFFVFHRC